MSAYLGSIKVWDSSPPAPPVSAGWVRPSDWLPLPEVLETDNKMVGLYAVYEGAGVPNWCAFRFTTVDASPYFVDWGDGTPLEEVASNAAAQHSFDATALGAGTLSVRGYRQAIITVTVGVGKSIATMTLNVRHTSASAANYSSAWLDVTIAAPSGTGILPSSNLGNAQPKMLERCTIKAIGPQTAFTNMFHSCNALQSVPLFDTSSGTSFNAMFQLCSLLSSSPLFNTSQGINFASMFNACTSIKTVPLFDTGQGIVFNGMFLGCTIQTVPLFNTSQGTNFAQMFQSSFIQSVPLFNTSQGTSFLSMVYNCLQLKYISPLDVSQAANFNPFFNTSPSLQVGALSGTVQDIIYPAGQLSGPQLNAIYEGLGTVSGKTITVTGNFGVATHTPSIATAKGWTCIS